MLVLSGATHVSCTCQLIKGKCIWERNRRCPVPSRGRKKGVGKISKFIGQFNPSKMQKQHQTQSEQD
ncbi:hypothetical protein RchiOBHm_Chr1g0376151 [Rosa chinensis]|uniref:Uncharacterized protein n=1 Tax=Rosa chinensis TaxID=74649 RepID=A0A2P6SMU3_ROSCH|nr:hypothetical protein RchiOBHm_Chr1g0376151 [Rosa chinensis]